MCGLAGILASGGQFGGVRLRDLAQRMADSLHHRGPDSGGLWSDDEAGIALGHRRLAIIDLSPHGHQPMVSSSGRHVIVFNGEIYNHGDLRDELAAAGHRFRGHSDTEVLLALIEERGFEAALAAAAGMFALAVWDRATRQLHLARDRLGEKPLYLAQIDGAIAFSSELKAFARLPGCDFEVDRFALSAFLRRQYVPAPRTVWRNVIKLPAGTLLSLPWGAAGFSGDLAPLIRPYWSVPATREDLITDEAEAVATLDHTLSLAVQERMIADVPIGAFLSGGIDSSLIVAMMQEHSSRSVRTFTVGFDEAEHDETAKARAVARHLGTDHTEIHISAEEARSVIPMLPDIFDEPFADASQIPSWHLARVAREAVTVSLSGDGGDESFAGYGRYMVAAGLERRLGAVPRPLRHLAAGIIEAVPVTGWDRALKLVELRAPQGYKGRLTGDRLHKAARLLAAGNAWERYQSLLDVGAADVLMGGAGWDMLQRPAANDDLHCMMLHDTTSYLADDVLAKVDRTSMAVSLEVRPPLLDHRVVELAWRFPSTMKIRDGKGKWLLRRLLEKRLPAELVDSGKAGFGVPLDRWLREPLRDWAEWLLDKRRLAGGYLDPVPVRRLWDEHLSGRYNNAAPLWSILMFEAWRDRWCHEATRQWPVAAAS